MHGGCRGPKRETSGESGSKGTLLAICSPPTFAQSFVRGNLSTQAPETANLAPKLVLDLASLGKDRILKVVTDALAQQVSSTHYPVTLKHCIHVALVSTSVLCAEDITFPPDAGVADVKRDYGAKGDGVHDDTEAIQKALTEKKRLIYFPNGTYLISHTLRWAESKKGTTSRQIFQGQSQAGAIIKLKDKCPGFQNPSSPNVSEWISHPPLSLFPAAPSTLFRDILPP